MKVKITLPLDCFDDGQEVYKPTGEKKYILKRQIKIYTDDKPIRNINFDKDILFLIDDRGDIDTISKDKPMTAIFNDVDEAIDFLSQIQGVY